MALLLRLAIGFLLCTTLTAASDWPQFRGPQSDGTVAAPGTFGDAEIELGVAWHVPVGSSYSSVAVANGSAVTQFSDESGDWVAAFDTASGKTIWRHRLGDLFKGGDGADDGSSSSPTIAGDRVFALDSRGRLVALGLADGKLAWEKQLVEEFGARPASYGFATSPLVVDGVVVLQAGGTEGRSIVGLDPTNGQLLWSHGDEQVHYQSPSAMTLGGLRQVVAVSDGKIAGYVPRDGRELWSVALAEEDRPRSATPTFIGNDRFLILMGSGAVVFRVAAVGDGYQVEELYRTDSLGKTYAQPVYHDGHVYGFSGQVLTCMNADTGERVWRSRPPGGDGLILVDGQLVIFGARGQVVVADASPVEYRERARVQALGGSSLTWPAFADGRIFVRNLNELAAISVSHDGGGLSAQQGDATDHAFGIWLSKLAANPARAAEVDAFLAAHPQSPIVEGEYLHFLYRGDATDVSIEGSMNNSEAVEQMQRVAGTDLFYRTYRVEPGCRWQYRYLVDFENSTPDPRNPRRTPAVEGDEIYSEVVTPGYRLAAYLDRADGTAERADSLSSFTLESKILGYEKEIRVWLPPGYADSTRTYPLLIVNDGDAWLDRGRMVQTLDSVVGTTVAPVVVAFVPAFGAWWTEGGGSRTEEYVRMLADELVPAMAGRYRLTDDASSRGIVGNRFYGASAIFAGLSRPETFGKVGMQSLYLGLGIEGSLERLVADGAGRSVRIYFDWNRYDERNIDRGFDIARSSRGFAASLFAGGYAVQGGESLDSYGWTSWRNRTGAMLESMFPAGATPTGF